MAEYKKPIMTRVELRIEEAVLTACKAAAGIFPPVAQIFKVSGCAYFGVIDCKMDGS